MAHRKDECAFCRSRTCYARIVAADFDEVACLDHMRDLERHADRVLAGQKRRHIVSSAPLRRGEE
jgi:hypothetical protein